MSEPLHVQVARVLGWWDIEFCHACQLWHGQWPGPHIRTPHHDVTRYDLSWDATGPLLERFGISLERAQAAREDGGPYGAWRWARSAEEIPIKKHWGATPLLAICNLILALSAAGKLEV